jgi:sugar-specific transcriptional regulator TrmB
MLNSDRKDTETLTKLGLTVLQAEIYLTLAKMGKATIRTLSSTSKIDRANVYRVVTRLQELKLVEKLIANPTVYRTLPVKEAIQMLLDRKEIEHELIRAKTRELLEKYKEGKLEIFEKECEFVLIPDGKLTIRRITEMIDSNKKTHDIIIHWKDFKHAVDDCVSRWANLLLKGIKIRVIVYLEKDENLPKTVTELMKNNPCTQLEIRITPSPPKSTISIIDGREALLSVTPSISTQASGLWINNPGIVGVIQDYFEFIWSICKKAH